VRSVDAATGKVIVEVSAVNMLGRHVGGTVEMELES
jgi:hypothetical protein